MTSGVFSSESGFKRYYDPEQRFNDGNCQLPELILWAGSLGMLPILRMDTSTRTRKVVCVVGSTAVMSGIGAAALGSATGGSGLVPGAIVGAGLGLTIGIVKVLGDESIRNRAKREQLVPA